MADRPNTPAAAPSAKKPDAPPASEAKPAKKKPRKAPPVEYQVELRRDQTIDGRLDRAGTVIGLIQAEPPFTPNFLIDGCRTDVCGEHIVADESPQEEAAEE